MYHCLAALFSQFLFNFPKNFIIPFNVARGSLFNANPPAINRTVLIGLKQKATKVSTTLFKSCVILLFCFIFFHKPSVNLIFICTLLASRDY